MKVLKVTSSIMGGNSFSLKLANEIVEKLQAENENVELVERNLMTSKMPHLSETHIKALMGSDDIDPQEKEAFLTLSNTLIDEVMEADVIVIGVPMYNFGIPSVLKAWIDLVLRAQTTFKYTENGPVGLVENTKAYLAVSTGGVYSDDAMKSYDFTETYMKTALAFIGITDVKAFRVEGVNMPDLKDAALGKAIDTIEL